MSIQISVLSVTNETKPTAKGSYNILEVAYKNLTFQNKVESKKIVSFGAQADAYKVLATAKALEVYEIEVVKNDEGYNDWTKVTRGDATAATQGTATAQVGTSKSAGSVASPKSTYETPEERAQKQIYIVRQSSISAAIEVLVHNHPKAAFTTDEVIKHAKQFEAFVFGKEREIDELVKSDVGGIEELPEDIPY